MSRSMFNTNFYSHMPKAPYTPIPQAFADIPPYARLLTFPPRSGRPSGPALPQVRFADVVAVDILDTLGGD